MPNIFEAKIENFVRTTHRLYHDGAHPSSLKLSVLPAMDEYKGIPFVVSLSNHMLKATTLRS